MKTPWIIFILHIKKRLRQDFLETTRMDPHPNKYILISQAPGHYFQLETIGKLEGGWGKGKEQGGTAPVPTSMMVHIETWKEKGI